MIYVDLFYAIETGRKNQTRSHDVRPQVVENVRLALSSRRVVWKHLEIWEDFTEYDSSDGKSRQNDQGESRERRNNDAVNFHL